MNESSFFSFLFLFLLKSGKIIAFARYLVNPSLLLYSSSPFSPSTQHSAIKDLVLASSSLARLELLEVPATDLHVSRVVVHALSEVLRRARAVVAPLALLTLTLLHLRVDLLRCGLCRRFGGAAAEEAADGVADGGAYCDTTIRSCVSIVFGLEGLFRLG